MDYEKLYQLTALLLPVTMIIVAGLKKEFDLQGSIVKVVACVVSAAVVAFYGFIVAHLIIPMILALYISVALSAMFGYNLLTNIMRRAP